MTTKKRGGNFIIVTVSIVLIFSILLYIAFNAYISPYLGNAQLRELRSIYNDLSKPVDEEGFTSNPPSAQDYLLAKGKMEGAGIDIFDEENNISPELIEEGSFLPSSSITLTDKELASVINKFLENPENLQKVGISNEDIGGLNTQVLQVNIDSESAMDVVLNFVVKLDMSSIKQKLGFFGIFLPSHLYVSSTSTLRLMGAEYRLVEGDILINNMAKSKNDRMLEILVDALQSNSPELTVQTIKQATGKTILEGIKHASNTFNTSITFSDGHITFAPKS